MAINTKFTVDNSELKRGLQEAELTAQKSGDKIKQNLSEGAKGFGAIQKMGGQSAGFLKNLINGFQSLLSPINAVAAAVGLITVAVVNLWDKFTETPEEKLKKLTNQLKEINNELQGNKESFEDLQAVEKSFNTYNKASDKKRQSERGYYEKLITAINRDYGTKYKLTDDNRIINLSEKTNEELFFEKQTNDLQDKQKTLEGMLNVNLEDIGYTNNSNELLSILKRKTSTYSVAEQLYSNNYNDNGDNNIKSATDNNFFTVPYSEQLFNIRNYLADMGKIDPNSYQTYDELPNFINDVLKKLSPDELNDLIYKSIKSDSFFYGNHDKERHDIQGTILQNFRELKENNKALGLAKDRITDIKSYANKGVERLSTLNTDNSDVIPGKFTDKYKSPGGVGGYLFLHNNKELLKLDHQQDEYNSLKTNINTINEMLPDLLNNKEFSEDEQKKFTEAINKIKEVYEWEDKNNPLIGELADVATLFNPNEKNSIQKKILNLQNVNFADRLNSDVNAKISNYDKNIKKEDDLFNNTFNKGTNGLKNQTWIDNNYKNNIDTVETRFIKHLVDNLKITDTYSSAEDLFNTIKNTPFEKRSKSDHDFMEYYKDFSDVDNFEQQKKKMEALKNFSFNLDFDSVKTNELAARGGFAESVVNNTDDVNYKIYTEIQKFQKMVERELKIG